MIVTIYSNGKALPEMVLLLGNISNKTTVIEYDTLSNTLSELLTQSPSFPKTVLDRMIQVDSFPNEDALIKAQSLSASFILWGSIESYEYGSSVTLKIMDMAQASVAHIQIMIKGNEDGITIAEMIRSKLLLWLRRTTMVQLIITTTPDPADVLLDNKEIGITPFEGMVQPGTYKLELLKKSYTPVRIPVSFISGNTYQYDFSLSTTEKKKDVRSVVKWLSVPVTFLGAGVISHWQTERAIKKYRNAKPPEDFDHLYDVANAWNVSRDVSFAVAGISLGVIVIKAVF